GLYFILKVLNTSSLVVSTFSLVFCALANYLLLRRSSYYALAFVINDIFLVTLWLIAAIESNFSLVLMLINSLVFSVNDVYGFFRWRKQEKQQPKQDEKTEQQVLQQDESQPVEKTEQNI
ncbi:MAG: nicotinamide mononucleotide transporter, partial [Clostridia bacterium]|nr:nicotinamide mononucleotide transporter [Clostridia bacterium]